ncbi:MAG TPA: energy transducer TonB [Blastocatellia bacterium]|nr:energy transducer TonB [Blastocatellia bacterium]
MAIILAAVLCGAATLTNAGAPQQKHASYGPAVSAYLTGLDEELNELEYQLRRDEITRADYERAKQRLTILRRSVERYASENRKDIVPEYQALAVDELKTVGLSKEYKADDLIVGAELEGQWKIVEVQPRTERKPVRFLVLERLQRAADGVARESKAAKTIDPRDVIETIVVPEPDSPFPPPPQPSNSQNSKVEPPPEAQKPGLQAPRLLSIMMPEYTGKARDKKVEGEVIVLALFQRDGKIKDAKVEKGLGFGLDDRAIEAVKRMSFLPAQLDGKEVDARARIIVGFNLEKVYVYVGVAELSDGGQGEK